MHIADYIPITVNRSIAPVAQERISKKVQEIVSVLLQTLLG